MAVYHEAPFTIASDSPIPEDAAPAVGVDEYGNREVIAEASEEFAAEEGIAVTVSSRGRPFEAELTLEPAQDFEEGFLVDWDFGDGTRETGSDLVQRNTYAAPGSFSVTAVVTQVGLASRAVSQTVLVGEDGTVA